MVKGSLGRTKTHVFVVVVVIAAACGGRSNRIDGSEGDDDTGGSAGSAGSASSRGGESGTGGTSGASSGGTGAARGGGSSAGGRTAGGSSAGGSTGGSTYPECDPTSATGGSGVVIVPDDSGWIDRQGTNETDINGGWYPFGDQYPFPDREKCVKVGLHAPEECSIVTSPDPRAGFFPQVVPGEMCTSGEVALVLPCAPGVTSSGCPAGDYVNMTGAGIAVDFNSEGGSLNAPRHPWDPAPHGFIGFSFEIDTLELPSLRVEIPMVLTDEEAATATPPLPPGSTTNDLWGGSPYWGANVRHPPSPICSGVNRVLWTDVDFPQSEYGFDPSRMLGIQFRVPTNAVSRTPYRFCIKNLTLLRN
jgi:hypothetical protein